MSSPITRRGFIATAAAATCAPALFARIARPVARRRSDAIRIAVVGVQGQGAWNRSQLGDEPVVALCDVDALNLGRASEQHPGAVLASDFRRLFDDHHDAFDAVLVATPDHLHAPVALAAMQLGKHVYCEKPLARTVEETRLMRRMAATSGVATQMGTQIHAGGNYRRVVERIRSGAIGTVREVHVWCNKSWSDGRFGPAKTPPAHLDWPLWLGPRPDRPYCDGLHPANWRRFWDYGTGTLGDMGCHYLDLVHWALDLDAPTRVHALGPGRHDVGTPDSLIVASEYPAKGDRPAVTVTWYDGRNRPSILQAMRDRSGRPIEWGDGHLWVGDDGFLLSDYGRHVLLPESRFADVAPPERTIPDSIGHHAEWFRACRTGAPTTCNFDYSGGLSESVLLGNVAFRAGRPIEWDAAGMTTGDDAIDRLLRAEPRDGWALPDA